MTARRRGRRAARALRGDRAARARPARRARRGARPGRNAEPGTPPRRQGATRAGTADAQTREPGPRSSANGQPRAARRATARRHAGSAGADPRWRGGRRRPAARRSAARPRGVFFVVGRAKSGTTWLMRTLDAHPEIACRGEGRFFGRDYVLPGPETATIPARPLAGALAADAALRSWLERSVWTRDRDPDEQLAELTRIAIDHFLAQTARETGKRIVGDKTPFLSRDIVREIAQVHPPRRSCTSSATAATSRSPPSTTSGTAARRRRHPRPRRRRARDARRLPGRPGGVRAQAAAASSPPSGSPAPPGSGPRWSAARGRAAPSCSASATSRSATRTCSPTRSASIETVLAFLDADAEPAGDRGLRRAAQLRAGDPRAQPGVRSGRPSSCATGSPASGRTCSRTTTARPSSARPGTS